MSSKRASWRIAGIAVLGLAAIALVVGLNPANLPEPWIQRWLDAKLPDGSSIVAVRQAIEAEGWTTVDENMYADASDVTVHIGTSWLPRRFVYADFIFDRFGRLLEIRVAKSESQRPSTES